MSLADDAKLLLIPTGYKTSKVYSVFPTDGDGDFTYTRSGNASRVNPGGLIETVGTNIPRIDHFGGGCPTLNLEPQRTNEFTYSEEFNQSVWFKSNCTITTNQIIAPDGTLTADLATSTGNGGGVFRFSSWTTTQKTASIFVKKNISSTVEILNASSGLNRVVFDLDSGTITTQGGTMTGTIEDFGNGWFRLSATHATVTGNQTFGLRPATNQSLFIWGGQFEIGSYPTSYIKTTSGQVTRQKDQCLNGGVADLFSSEGTIFIDVVPFKTSSSFTAISLNDDSSSNRCEFFFYASSNQVRFIIAGGGGGLTLSHYETITYNQRNKMAITFKENEAKVYLNGTLELTDTSVDEMIGLDRLEFTLFNGTLNFEGKIHDTRVYDRVLTQTEAETLTTL